MIELNLKHIKSLIPNHIQLVAVSKTKPPELILEAYQAGQRVFGENKAQELAEKHDKLPKDIDWHFIGHLQKNKVKYIAPFVQLIHAVDSLSLLKTINKEAIKNNRTINVLLQFHIANEQSKFGLNFNEAELILRSPEFTELNNIKIIGVMGMATFTDNSTQVKKEFKHLNKIFSQIKTKYFFDDKTFKEISMGMSGDYSIAIKEGSTMIRVGSSIFGNRNL